MSTPILWPAIGPKPPRTMAEMLYDHTAGLGQISQNKLDFYVDAVGVASKASGPVTDIRYNCYIRVIQKTYLHLIFQVTTPSGSPFPARFGTPEGDVSEVAQDEAGLISVIGKILGRQATIDAMNYLMRVAIP